MVLEELIAGLTDELAPIGNLAAKFSDPNLEATPTHIRLCHRPDIAPRAFALCLHFPLDEESIRRYQTIHEFTISPLYLRVLQKLNGMSAFGFVLFGIPPSMAKSPPLLDRSVLQPMDIAVANNDWKREYFVADELFYIGMGAYSDDEYVGYFLAETGNVHAFRKNGEAVGGWCSLRPFLQDELTRAEETYPKLTQCQDLESKRRKRWWRR